MVGYLSLIQQEDSQEINKVMMVQNLMLNNTEIEFLEFTLINT